MSFFVPRDSRDSTGFFENLTGREKITTYTASKDVFIYRKNKVCRSDFVKFLSKIIMFFFKNFSKPSFFFKFFLKIVHISLKLSWKCWVFFKILLKIVVVFSKFFLESVIFALNVIWNSLLFQNLLENYNSLFKTFLKTVWCSSNLSWNSSFLTQSFIGKCCIFVKIFWELLIFLQNFLEFFSFSLKIVSRNAT